MNQLVMERMATPTARVRSARRPAAPAPRPHEVRSMVALAAGVLAILVLALWSFAQGWGRGPVVGPGELALDGGIVRVDGAVSAARPQHAMPGMGTDEDPVADGMRRVSIDVTLMAGTEQLEYSTERFGVTVDGEPADRLTHRDVLPGDVLPPGTQLSGTILVDVPVDATTATLTYAGSGSADVVLPAEGEQSAPGSSAEDAMTGAGHGGGDHATGTDADGAGQ